MQTITYDNKVEWIDITDKTFQITSKYDTFDGFVRLYYVVSFNDNYDCPRIIIWSTITDLNLARNVVNAVRTTYKEALIKNIYLIEDTKISLLETYFPNRDKKVYPYRYKHQNEDKNEDKKREDEMIKIMEKIRINSN